MIVVDSSVWIAQLRKVDSEPVRKLKTVEDPGEILVGDLILLEVLQGARDDAHAASIERALRQFEIARMFDDGVAVQAARHYRVLREKSITVRKTIDVIVATFCILGRHKLLHGDRDFDPFVRHLGLRAL